VADAVVVWIDQEECTGDGLCIQDSPDVFEMDIDGLAYVKDGQGDLLTAARASRPVPVNLLAEVAEVARKCPGRCIYVRNQDTGEVVAGPEDAD
jgi:ferredoxin